MSRRSRSRAAAGVDLRLAGGNVNARPSPRAHGTARVEQNVTALSLLVSVAARGVARGGVRPVRTPATAVAIKGARATSAECVDGLPQPRLTPVNLKETQHRARCCAIPSGGSCLSPGLVLCASRHSAEKAEQRYNSRAIPVAGTTSGAACFNRVSNETG